MNQRRWMALTLSAGGICLLVLGLDQHVNAVQCERRDPIFPGRCIAARQVHPEEFEPNLNYSCDVEYGICVPAEGSVCGTKEGYATPAPGECVFFAGYDQLLGCVENIWTSVVRLDYHYSVCGLSYGVCDCYWVTGGHPPMIIHMCDCAQTSD